MSLTPRICPHRLTLRLMFPEHRAPSPGGEQTCLESTLLLESSHKFPLSFLAVDAKGESLEVVQCTVFLKTRHSNDPGDAGAFLVPGPEKISSLGSSQEEILKLGEESMGTLCHIYNLLIKVFQN